MTYTAAGVAVTRPLAKSCIRSQRPSHRKPERSTIADDVARRVADGRREPYIRRDHVVQLHQLNEAGVTYSSKFKFCGVADNFSRSGRGWTVAETCSACAGT